MFTIGKKILSAISLLFAATLFLSCDGSKIYRNIDDFEDNRWAKTDVRTFEFDIPAEGDYNLTVLFSHVYDTPLSNIPLVIKIETPDGKSEIINIIMHIRDEDGKQLADCGGDYCDFEQAIFRNRKLAEGPYKISVSNTFDYEYMPNVIGIGISVNKSELK